MVNVGSGLISKYDVDDVTDSGCGPSSICVSVCGCVLVMMSSSLLTAVPLSERHLKNVFENTSDLSYLCLRLNIPDDKRTVAGAVEYYRQSTEPRKVRKMIWELDNIGDTALADSVMECAEPPAGMCILMFMYIAQYYTLSETSIRCTQVVYGLGRDDSVDW